MAVLCPLSWMRTTSAIFQGEDFNDFVKMIFNGKNKACAQILKKADGNSSGPGAQFISSIKSDRTIVSTLMSM